MNRPIRTALLVAASFAGGACAAHVAAARPGDESPYAALGQLARVLVIVENDYVDPVERDKLLNGAIKGMVAELDPHSAYMPPDDNEIFRSETDGKFGGVGLEVEMRDDRLIVVAPIEGGPAERAGIKSGDRILGIGGESTQGAQLDKLVRRMRGDPGTSIDVQIATPGTEPRTVTLVREEIKVSSVVGKRLAGDIAYIRVKQFQATTHEELLRLVGKLRDKGRIAGVVLDLRNNPGGLVDQATGVADELLAAGTIYTTRHRGKVIDEVSATSGGALTEIPAVVLVNEYSASASELVAGALQDHRRASVVGAKTFGKGSVQSILQLPGGAGLRLTTMRYYTPKGQVIQAAGITPDIVVEQSGVGTSAAEVVRESDLEGHLPPSDGLSIARPDAGAKPPSPSRVRDAGADAAPRDAGADAEAGAGDAAPRDAKDGRDGKDAGPDDVEFGIAKKVPDDPTGGKDHVLSVGYQLVKTLIAKKP